MEAHKYYENLVTGDEDQRVGSVSWTDVLDRVNWKVPAVILDDVAENARMETGRK